MNANRRKHMRMLGKLLFFLYVLFLIYFLLFSDWYGRSGELRNFRYNLELFKEIKRFWTYREKLGFFATFTNLIGNIFIFVPFGFFLPMASKYRSFFFTLFYSFGVSLCVEIFQFFARIGSFDVDDLFLNTVGGVAGFILFMICNTVRRHYDEKKRHG